MPKNFLGSLEKGKEVEYGPITCKANEESANNENPPAVGEPKNMEIWQEKL